MNRTRKTTYLVAICHIINRGSHKDRIFRRKRAKGTFLSRMQAEVTDIMQMKLLAAGDLIRRFEKQLLQSKNLQKKLMILGRSYMRHKKIPKTIDLV